MGWVIWLRFCALGSGVEGRLCGPMDGSSVGLQSQFSIIEDRSSNPFRRKLESSYEILMSKARKN